MELVIGSFVVRGEKTLVTCLVSLIRAVQNMQHVYLELHISPLKKCTICFIMSHDHIEILAKGGVTNGF